MGLFYFSVTTKGPTQAELVNYFQVGGRRVLVSPSIETITTLFDWEYRRGGVASRRIERAAFYERGASLWEPLVTAISRQFMCNALAVEVYDDDIFYYQLHDAGNLRDEYCSDVLYFGKPAYNRLLLTDNITMLLGSDHAAKLCDAFERRYAYKEVKDVLDIPYQTIQGQDQHAALIRALHMPENSRYQGYPQGHEGWIETRP